MQDDSAEPDLTPMLDVVFIMLIFFIVTATFVKEIGIDLPSGDSQNRQAQSDTAILVEVDEHDRYYLDQKHIDARALGHHLTRLHAEYPDRKLVVKPANDASTAAVVYVMDAGNLAGIVVGLAEPPAGG